MVKVYKLFTDNMTFRIYNRMLVNENKWRAMRYGIDGELIDFGKQQSFSARQLIHELVDFVDDVVDDLGSREAVAYALKILETGTSADRQLATYERTQDFKAVVDQVIAETLEGVPVDPSLATIDGLNLKV
jgi:carboxylate-amine ligase